MKISDIVELAKAGYKPSDVLKLLEYVETDPGAKDAQKEDVTGDDSVDNKKKKEEEPKLNAFEKLIAEENKEE